MSQSFVDYSKIHVQAGAGGDGCVSFRREKFVPRGGPDGGDGGQGGSVWLEASSDLATLIDLKLRPSLKASRGAHGQGKNMSGRAGGDLVVRVPLGTLVLDADDQEIADLVQPGQRFRAAAGGRGGAGNQHYATPTNQAPRHAKPGEPGETQTLQLELKLIAQAGLIGLPNAGKSTLLARLTHATPRIAPYPFTTLHPNLGVMEVEGYRRVTLADIPGLIEGACKGAGLGHRFLRHIERTGILVHLIAPPEDLMDLEQGDDGEFAALGAAEVVEAYRMVRRELASHSPLLAEKPERVVLTKVDLLAPATRSRWMDALEELGPRPLAISSETGEGLEELRQALTEELDGRGMIPEDDGGPSRALPYPGQNEREVAGA